MKRRVLGFIGIALIFLGFSSAWAFELKNGVGTDTWTTWPEPREWDKAKFVDNYPEWRGIATQAQIKSLKSSGFDFVRLTLDPAVFLWKPTAAKRKRLLTSLRKTVDSLLAADLNVIVDMHTIPRDAGQPGTDSILKSDASFGKYLSVVQIVAKSVAAYDPDRVAFEPFNEPNIDCPWDGKTSRWPAMAKRLHATARAAAPQLAIIIQGGCWGGAEGLTALNPAAFKDQNIIWAFHTYDPMIFTHQGASWTSGVERYIEGMDFPPRSAQRQSVQDKAIAAINASSETSARKVELIRELKDELDDYFGAGSVVVEMQKPVTLVAAWAKKNKIPANRILVGEFGVIRSDLAKAVPASARTRYLQAAVKRFEAQGWAWSIWNWTGSFGIDTRDGSRLPDPTLLGSLGLGK